MRNPQHPTRLAAAACAAASLQAAAQDLFWLEQFGTSSQDPAHAAAADGAGGVFIAGETGLSLGGPNKGLYDAWLARYHPSGMRAWIVQPGTYGNDRAFAVAPDGAGGAFLAGETEGYFGGESFGFVDAWLARYDADGAKVWIRHVGSAHFDHASALAPDGAGGVFMAGATLGSLGGAHKGSWDAWLARLDASGAILWAAQIGTSSWDEAGALAPDGDGGVFIAGWTRGSLGGPNQGMSDAWVARYDGQGNQQWITQFGGASYDEAYALAPDGAGGLFIAGFVEAGFNNQYGFLARYDGSGEQLWLSHIGTELINHALAVAADGDGGVFVSGYTNASLGGPHQGSWDAWLARYNAAGDQHWITQFGTSKGDQASALAPDAEGGVFVGGFTSGALGDQSFGGPDAYLARFSGAGQTCYSDLNGDGLLSFFDFLAFANLFNAADPTADCDGSGGLDLFDFFCFVNAFNTGCG